MNNNKFFVLLFFLLLATSMEEQLAMPIIDNLQQIVLQDRVETLIKQLPEKPAYNQEGISLVKAILQEVLQLTKASSMDSKMIIKSLKGAQDIARDSEFKREEFQTPTYGTMSLELFGNIVIKDLIKDFERLPREIPALLSVQTQSQAATSIKEQEVQEEMFASLQKKLDELNARLGELIQPSAQPIAQTEPMLPPAPTHPVVQLPPQRPPNPAPLQPAAQRPPSPVLPSKKENMIHGLVNPRNACFMNAALQGLYSLDKLTDALLTKANTNFYEPRSFADAYVQLAQTLRTSTESTINPKQVCLQGWKRLGIARGTDYDSAEFLGFLLNHLISADINPQTGIKENNEVANLIKITFLPSIDNQPIPLESLFLLPLQPSRPMLEQCIEEFFSPEMIRVGKPLRDAVKSQRIVGMSPYFIIGLKRLTYNTQLNKYEKINKPIAFPLENLDLRLYANANVPLYHLKAFVVHSGQGMSGHYYAYIRSGDNWFRADDTSVRLVSDEEITKIARTGSDGSPHNSPIIFFYEAQ